MVGGGHGSNAEISFGGLFASSAIAACFAEVLSLTHSLLLLIESGSCLLEFFTPSICWSLLSKFLSIYDD